MTSHQLLAEWSQWFWPVFADHLWQATLFAFVVWIAVKSLNQAPARFRHFLWLIALAKFLVPSALLVWLIGQAGVDLSLPFEAIQSATSTAASGIATAYTEVRIIFQIAQSASPVEQTMAPSAIAANHHVEFYCALTIVWLFGALAAAASWLIRRWRFARLLRGDRTITSGREFDALKRAQSWLFVNCEIGLVVSSQVREPGVWRVRHPVIVLPENIADRLSDEEIEAVMMHELIHVLHRDNLIGILQMIVCSLFWFHPLAHLIDRRLLAEREMWCDETVVRLGGEPKLYAASLWKVAQFGLGWPVAGVSRAAGSILKRRLERMLTSNDQLEMTIARRAAAYASIFVLAFLSIGVGLLGDSAFAQLNKIEATSKKGLAESVKGGVEGGVPGGVEGGSPGVVRGSVRNGIPGGVEGGALDAGSDRISVGIGKGSEGGVTGGVIGVVDAAKTVQVANPDNKGDAQSQRPNKWELIKQAPEFSVKAENRSDSPLQITDARVRVMADVENPAPKDLESAEVIIAQFEITLVNQTDRRITGAVLEYKNPGLAGEKFQIGPPILPYNSPIEPYGSYVIGKNLLHHHRRTAERVPDYATLFAIRVAGVKFENEPHFNQLNSSTPPKITYKENAHYTKEARDKKVTGAVVLSIVFGADGRIGEIEVVQGLPYGLTESAIAAAKKIRFEPATKDGLPVSERMTRVYYFSIQ